MKLLEPLGETLVRGIKAGLCSVLRREVNDEK